MQEVILQEQLHLDSVRERYEGKKINTESRKARKQRIFLAARVKQKKQLLFDYRPSSLLLFLLPGVGNQPHSLFFLA